MESLHYRVTNRSCYSSSNSSIIYIRLAYNDWLIFHYNNLSKNDNFRKKSDKFKQNLTIFQSIFITTASSLIGSLIFHSFQYLIYL